MKKIKVLSRLKDQRGVTALIVAILIFVLIGFIALGIDLGYLYSSRNELQNAADAAALAATGKLGNIYTGMPYSQQQTYDCAGAGEAAIRLVAREVALKNKAATKPIVIRDVDIIIGQWNAVARTLTSTTAQPDAVEVTARRDGTENGPISTFFASILDIATVDVSADATAALTGLGNVEEEGLPIPVGIASARFEDEGWCEDPLKFYPTTGSCSGWHVYEDDHTRIKQDILDGMLADPPTFTSPETEAGDVLFYFKGGTDNAAYEKLKLLFDEKKTEDDDDDPNTWTTTVVVFDSECYINPNEHFLVVGFAKIRIYEICTSSSDPTDPITGGEAIGILSPDDHCVLGEKKIVARVSCEYIEAGRGGGGEYGIKGSIPGLVE